MKTNFGLLLTALLALSVAACDDGGSGGSGGGGKGGSGGEGATGGGGSGAAGGSTTTSGTAGGGGGSSLSCAAYCTELMTNCTTTNQQFKDVGDCEAVCANYPVGVAGATDGASLGCRTYHGGDPAKGMPGTHCPHAGPLGGGVCGADCDNFCELADAICGDQAMKPYADVATCKTACAGFEGTATVPYNYMSVDGDSLACRMYHLTVASSSDTLKATHCPHIAAVSATCK